MHFNIFVVAAFASTASAATIHSRGDAKITPWMGHCGDHFDIKHIVKSPDGNPAHDAVDPKWRAAIPGNKQCRNLGEHSDAITIRFEVDKRCSECHFFE
jgi:hypothetical protein